MSEARFESVMNELRATAPSAPDRLGERVRALREPQAKLVWRLRPALVAAVGVAMAVGIGAAAIGGLTRSAPPKQESLASEFLGARSPAKTGGAVWAPNGYQPVSPKTLSQDLRTLSPLVPGSRLQQFAVSMSLRVHDLSQATKAAVRQTRRLGGYVAAADYATGNNTDDSNLDLRVPVQHVQQAIASFTELGTILSQHIAVADLQAPLDRTDARIAALRKRIASYEATNDPRLAGARRTLRRLTQSRTNLLREGTYAKISLQLTTRKAATKHVAPGRFSRFWGDAGDILGKEAIAVLYALVVAGPFLILAALALFGGRARRRRADHRLLEETG